MIYILNTLILYFYIVFCYRIMGKKEGGQLGIIDLIVSILIAELAAMGIENIDKPIYISMLPILVLVLLQIFLSYIALKSTKFRKFIDGNPQIIINKGKVDFKTMQKIRYSLDDLISQLREQGIKNIKDVKYAILENNGKLSVFNDDNTYPMPIIIDGIIDVDTVKNMKKNINWVYDILNKNNIKLKDVFYAFHSKNKTFIIRKN